jgi:hypothetical protein
VKRLNELKTLIRLAQTVGQTPDSKILDELSYLEEKQAKQQLLQTKLKQRVNAASKELFNTEVSVPVLENEAPAPLVEEVLITPEPKPQTAAAQVADYITRNPIKETVVSQGEPGLVSKSTDPIVKKVDLLERWISRIAATGPGGGEVNLRWLDDVDRTNITDGQYLRYDGPTKKFTFDAGHHNNYYLAVQSSQTQTSNATSATTMTFNVIDSNFGITITSNSRIVIFNPGTYNLQFSSQFVNTGNTPDDVYVWFRLNGTDVPASNSTVTIPAKDNRNVPGKVIASWNYIISTTSVGEYVELMWFAADDTHVTMPFISSIAATATTPTIPATPSVILTVTPVKVNSY